MSFCHEHATPLDGGRPFHLITKITKKHEEDLNFSFVFFVFFVVFGLRGQRDQGKTRLKLPPKIFARTSAPVPIAASAADCCS